jgi:zinc and cadmium transporter
MSVLLWITGATVVVGLVALVGVFSLWMSSKALNKLLLILVAFSAGALLSGALFHLLAEALGQISQTMAFIYLLFGFSLFFLIERILHWHHCHNGKCDEHQFTYLVLFGDAVHNFVDGVIIAASFIVSIPFGLITTVLIIGHEIPQELGNFGILVYGGFSKGKALLYNFIAQLTAVLGGIVGYFLSNSVKHLIPFVLPFAAGGFVYIAACDLVPELHKQPDLRKSLNAFAFFIIGIIFILIVEVLFEH